MTKDEADEVLRALEDHAPKDVVDMLRAHIAALEQERDTRAASATTWKTVAEEYKRERDESLDWIRVVSEELVMAGGSTGDRTVALANLRSIRQERDAAVADNAAVRARLKTATETAQRCIDNEEITRGERDVARRDADVIRAGHATLLEEHIKALVRARNEGLEKAASAADVLMEGQNGGVLTILRMVAKDIRAMKEPVSEG